MAAVVAIKSQSLASCRDSFCEIVMPCGNSDHERLIGPHFSVKGLSRVINRDLKSLKSAKCFKVITSIDGRESKWITGDRHYNSSK